MKYLIRFAVGAVAAGVLANMFMKRRLRSDGQTATADGPDEVRSSVDDMAPDTNSVSGGDAGEDQRGPQPQDWRGAQNVLDS